MNFQVLMSHPIYLIGIIVRELIALQKNRVLLKEHTLHLTRLKKNCHCPAVYQKTQCIQYTVIL